MAMDDEVFDVGGRSLSHEMELQDYTETDGTIDLKPPSPSILKFVAMIRRQSVTFANKTFSKTAIKQLSSNQVHQQTPSQEAAAAVHKPRVKHQRTQTKISTTLFIKTNEARSLELLSPSVEVVEFVDTKPSNEDLPLPCMSTDTNMNANSKLIIDTEETISSASSYQDINATDTTDPESPSLPHTSNSVPPQNTETPEIESNNSMAGSLNVTSFQCLRNFVRDLVFLICVLTMIWLIIQLSNLLLITFYERCGEFPLCLDYFSEYFARNTDNSINNGREFM